MNSLSGGDLADIILALGVLVGALGTAAVPIIMALRRIDKAVASVEAKTEVIKASVDGAASKQVAKIESLEGTVDTLRGVIIEQRGTAKDLATVAAEASGAQATLQNIEQNTAQTAQNTEKI